MASRRAKRFKANAKIAVGFVGASVRLTGVVRRMAEGVGPAFELVHTTVRDRQFLGRLLFRLAPAEPGPVPAVSPTQPQA